MRRLIVPELRGGFVVEGVSLSLAGEIAQTFRAVEAAEHDVLAHLGLDSLRLGPPVKFA